jgi:hypothetical protein
LKFWVVKVSEGLVDWQIMNIFFCFVFVVLGNHARTQQPPSCISQVTSIFVVCWGDKGNERKKERKKERQKKDSLHELQELLLGSHTSVESLENSQA